MSNIIGLKDLRQNMTEYVKQIEKGKSFIVVKKNKPVFKLTAVNNEDWETVIDFTKLKKGGIPIKDLLSRL